MDFGIGWNQMDSDPSGRLAQKLDLSVTDSYPGVIYVMYLSLNLLI